MFAIMNAAGQFLPGGGRGGTWREFNDGPPRLFARRQDAESAMKWWLGGPGMSRWRGDEDTDDFYQSDDMLRIAAKRQAIASTIKVVEVELIVR